VQINKGTFDVNLVFTATLACTKRALFIPKKGTFSLLKKFWGARAPPPRAPPVPTPLEQRFHLEGNSIWKELGGNIVIRRTAGKFVVAVQRNCWRTRYFTKIRKFEKTTRVKFQLMILHF
jgi:hypothetical protein